MAARGTRAAARQSCELRALQQQMARERQASLDEIMQLRKQFAADLAALQSALRAAQMEFHRVRVIEQFRESERDYNVPLQ